MPDLLLGNEDQQKAIILNQGPALILAGPGSGKTFTIVERIRQLILTHGVEAGNILVITFTKAAARQMRDRFRTRMEGMVYPVNFGTFHAVFFHILQTSSHLSSAVLSEKEKREYLQRVLMTIPGDFSVDSEWENGLLGEIGFIKNAGRIPEDFKSAYLEDGMFRRVFMAFQKLLVWENRLDFDDFAAQCRHLFLKRPDILAGWQEKFSYILVDEFQDINPAQYEVVKLLAGKKRNLFVVGDDDQSIYGFRGSSPAIMKQFLTDYPEASQVLLSVNYRSRPGIVETAGKLIGVNKERFKKTVRAAKTASNDGNTDSVQKEGPASAAGSYRTAEKKGAFQEIWKPFSSDQSVRIGEFCDRNKQAETIAETLKVMQKNKEEMPVSAAVIFRTNTDAVPVAEALSEAGIPFFLQEAVKSPYAHTVCQDLLAYLRFVHQGQERREFYRIMNRPCRYLSRQAVTGKQVFWGELLDFYREKAWMLPYIRRFQADTARIGSMDLYAAIHYIRRGVGYDDWLAQNLEGEALRQAVSAADFLQDSVRKFKTLEAFLTHIKEYEKQLEEAHRKKEFSQDGRVALLTMHGAKGLEFDTVFLPDCNEGVTPHKKSLKAKEVEEERRMFYVGMTRAKEKLYLGWIAGTKDDPGFPSRFLGDLGYCAPWKEG